MTRPGTAVPSSDKFNGCVDSAGKTDSLGASNSSGRRGDKISPRRDNVKGKRLMLNWTMRSEARVLFGFLTRLKRVVGIPKARRTILTTRSGPAEGRETSFVSLGRSVPSGGPPLCPGRSTLPSAAAGRPQFDREKGSRSGPPRLSALTGRVSQSRARFLDRCWPPRLYFLRISVRHFLGFFLGGQTPEE